MERLKKKFVAVWQILWAREFMVIAERREYTVSITDFSVDGHVASQVMLTTGNLVAIHAMNNGMDKAASDAKQILEGKG